MAEKFSSSRGSSSHRSGERHHSGSSSSSGISYNTQRSKDGNKQGGYKAGVTQGMLFSFDIDSIIRDVLRQWYVIIIAGLMAGLFAGAVIQMRYVPRYSCNTTFVVNKFGLNISSASENINFAEELTNVFTTVTKSDLMRRRVKDNLGIDSFDANISLSAVPQTNLMTMSVTGYSPRETWMLANEVMVVAKELCADLENDMSIRVLEEPVIPTYSINPLNKRRPMMLACAGMMAFMVVIYVMLSYLNDTVKNTREFNYKIDGTLIGEIPHERKFKTIRSYFNRKSFSLCVDNPMLSFGYAESVRLMSTRVRKKLDLVGVKERVDQEGRRYILPDYSNKKGKVLTITSISENEGKSTVAANIALSLSQEGFRVALLDCDFRKPSQYKILDIPKEEVTMDIVEALRNGKDLQETEPGKNRALHAYVSTEPHGHVLTKTIEDGLKSILRRMKDTYDYIIIDSSPLGLVAESEKIATMSDACILVTEQDLIEARFINDTLDQLKESGHRLYLQ